MKHENKIKAELAEALIHCIRAVKIHLCDSAYEESYEKTKEQCYKELTENYSANDLLMMIKNSLKTLEVTDNNGKIIEGHPLFKMPLEPYYGYPGSNKGKSFTPDLPTNPWHNFMGRTPNLGIEEFYAHDPRDMVKPDDLSKHPDNNMG